MSKAPADEASVLTFSEIRVSLGGGDLGPFRARGRDEREYTIFELWELLRNPTGNHNLANLSSELNGRLVRMLSILGLPFLAVSLALGRRRSTRFYGIAVGGGTLILYHEILRFGGRPAPLALDRCLGGPEIVRFREFHLARVSFLRHVTIEAE